MSLFGFKEKKEIEKLKSQLTPDQRQFHDLSNEIEAATKELEHIVKEV